MIKKADGTCFKLYGDAASHDPNNVDHALFDNFDQEVIGLSGAPVLYYKFRVDSNHDPLYGEARERIIDAEGIEICMHWEPVPPQQDLGVFGIDSPDEIIFSVNLAEWRDKIGVEMPRVGGMIYTPWNKQRWEIIQYNIGEFKIWGKHRIEIVTRKWQDSTTTAPDPGRESDRINAASVEVR